ncbi:unnamed protein product [Diabrotica balteata]|uniref:THAP-type domain-containing protein n=1 Tax=Diabrotica balteata TaxID=107213 RepID=A0A9N9T6K5_DIABA|nr:unnamed protein product [Diabrotica balteata]
MPTTCRAYCSYRGCKNSKARHTDKSYHRFPKNESRRNLWIQHSGNLTLQTLTQKQLSHKFLCSDHFTDIDVASVIRGKNRLKDSAIPKNFATTDVFEALQNSTRNSDSTANNKDLFSEDSQLNKKVPILKSELCLQNGNDAHMSSSLDVSNGDQNFASFANNNLNLSNDRIQSIQIQLNKKNEELKNAQDALKQSALIIDFIKNKYEAKVKSKNDTILKYRRKVYNLNRKLNRVKTFSKEASELKKSVDKLDEEIKEFLDMQISHFKKSKWTEKEKQFAISLFYQSTKAYRYLREKKHFKLPCVSKIRIWINGLDSTAATLEKTEEEELEKEEEEELEKEEEEELEKEEEEELEKEDEEELDSTHNPLVPDETLTLPQIIILTS